jgi:hypothetical protein
MKFQLGGIENDLAHRFVNFYRDAFFTGKCPGRQIGRQPDLIALRRYGARQAMGSLVCHGFFLDPL